MKDKSTPSSKKKRGIQKGIIFNNISAFLEKRRKELNLGHSDIDGMLRNLQWSEISEDLDERLKDEGLTEDPAVYIV